MFKLNLTESKRELVKMCFHPLVNPALYSENQTFFFLFTRLTDVILVKAYWPKNIDQISWSHGNCIT